MAQKPPAAPVKKALEKSDYSPSKSTPSVYIHKKTREEISIDGNYGKKKDTGWLNYSNKKKV